MKSLRLYYVSLIPYKYENGCEYYNVVSLKKGNKILKKKGTHVVVICKRRKVCAASFNPKSVLSADTVNYISHFMKGLKNGDFGYDFKKEEWHSTFPIEEKGE